MEEYGPCSKEQLGEELGEEEGQQDGVEEGGESEEESVDDPCCSVQYKLIHACLTFLLANGHSGAKVSRSRRRKLLRPCQLPG